MTDEAEDSGCTSQDPDDVVLTGGGGNNNNNNNGSALLTAAVHSSSKKSKPSSVESAEVPGKLPKTSNILLNHFGIDKISAIRSKVLRINYFYNITCHNFVELKSALFLPIHLKLKYLFLTA